MKRLSAAQRKTLDQFLRFCVIGGLGFVFDTCLVYFGIDHLHMRRVTAGLFSFPFVVTFTWAGNRYFTFHDASRGKKHVQLMRFVMVCGVGLVFNRGTYSLLVSNVPIFYAYPVLALMAGTAAGMFFNFFVSKKLVFR
ncbi:MAG TPA: GtrA family protein [Alphaproteobacteria bacterium]|nr:GtrA family protein [Alphaproteobacteria bacterium]